MKITDEKIARHMIRRRDAGCYAAVRQLIAKSHRSLI